MTDRTTEHTAVATDAPGDPPPIRVPTDESSLRLALDAGRMAIWSVAADGSVDVSTEFKRLLRLPENLEPTLDELLARYYPGELERVQQLVEQASIEGQKYIEWEYRHLWPNDEVRWLLVRAELLRDSEGNPAGSIGVIMDVTERKRTELRRDALAELAERFRELDDPAELAFAAAQTLGRALNVSRVGYGTVDPLNETITIERDWNAPGIRSLAGVLNFREYGSYIENLKRGETVVFADADLDHRTADTADALKAISAQAVINMPVSEKGGLVALLYLNNATAREWTEDDLALVREVADRTRSVVARREAEIEVRALNRSLERRVDEALAERKLWADVFQSSDALIGALGPDRRILAMNINFASAFETIYGIRPQIGDHLPSLVAHLPDHARGWLADWERALGGEEFSVTHQFVGEDGSQSWYDLRFNILRSRDGSAVGAFQYGLDVTERVVTEARLVEAEDALRQSQKMEAMGQLTGGVAHDFNNLLTPIVGSLDLLQRRGMGGDRERRLIEGALQSAERAKTLVQRLLAFARRQPLQPIPVDLRHLISNMADLVASTSGPRVRVIVDLADELAPVHADLNQLEMAILNLSVNARDAMPEGGRLTISASEVDVPDDHRSNLKPGRYVRLSVADTGVGMDEATCARAVEPFFSTKGLGRGTGLGLSMVHGLAGQLGGTLTIQSKVGMGTNVEVWLPIANVSAAETADPNDVERLSSTGTVLLIEDEELVRASTADMLGELGYEVVEASSGEEALKLVTEGLKVELVITDHLMPGMTGTDVARAIEEQQPGTPILIVSGYADLEGIAPDLPRLSKPFRISELGASLAKLTKRS